MVLWGHIEFWIANIQSECPIVIKCLQSLAMGMRAKIAFPEIKNTIQNNDQSLRSEDNNIVDETLSRKAHKWEVYRCLFGLISYIFDNIELGRYQNMHQIHNQKNNE